MKVLDLQCTHGHVFEGWFSSEEDFVAQCDKLLVQCPFCGEATVSKRLSAPRLNLGHARQDSSSAVEVLNQPSSEEANLGNAWLALARRIVANTQDVGERFADEARKMHYGETPDRAIRGKTSTEEARALLDEGIAVLPFMLPQAAKETLQ